MRTSQTNTFRLLLLAAAAPLAFTTPVLAQDADDAVEEQSDERITVTARRREESLQDVPIAITAFTGEDLARRGVADITELSNTTPNVSLEVSRGTNTTLTAFIRGVGQQDPVAGFESGVGLYVDDVYLNRPQAAVLDIYDVERIEVLRGPQGTLYGRNTIGGAIKYVTKRLDDEFTADLRLSVGSYDQFDGILKVGMPITDTLRIGGAVARLTRDGFGENLNLEGVENYNKDVWAGRASIEFEPTSDLFFRLSGDYIQDDSDPRQGNRLTVGNLTGAPILDNEYDTRAGLTAPEQEVTAKGISLLGEWQINDAFTVKNILSYREDETLTPIDFDSLPSSDLDVPAEYTNEQFSEELQLLYEGDRLNGVVGFYYLDANAFNRFDVLLFNLVPDFNSFSIADVDTKTWSVFGDFTYDILPTVSVSLGGRYTSDERSARILRQSLLGSSFFGPDPIVLATTSDFRGEETFTDFTPRASISWKPTDNYNLYVSYSEGFKGGSFDPRGVTTAAPDTNGDGTVSEREVFNFMQFDPETVETYEIGLKSSLFGGRLNSSIAVFYSDYTDVQVPGSVGVDTDGDGEEDNFIGITSNAGAAEFFGVEFEGTAALAEDLLRGADSLNASWAIGYLDAEYVEFINAFGVDISDEAKVQNTPEWTLSGTLTYDTPFAIYTEQGNLTFINTVSYRGEHQQFEQAIPLIDEDGYTLWDASLVWEHDSGMWRVGVHGKNLTDERYNVAGYNFPTLGLEGTVTTFLGNPRTVTGTLDVRF